MATLREIKDGLVQLMRYLASEDMSQPLPDGAVVWFNQAQPFISQQTQCGIYLRILQIGGYGRSAKRYRTVSKVIPTIVNNRVVPVTTEVLEHCRESQGFILLQVQVKGLEGDALTTATRIGDNIEDPIAADYLQRLKMSLISTGNVLCLPGEIIDQHEAEIATLEVRFQVANEVQGLDALPIEHISGTGSVTGGVVDPVEIPFQV